jgi:hypothetical protein
VLRDALQPVERRLRAETHRRRVVFEVGVVRELDHASLPVDVRHATLPDLGPVEHVVEWHANLVGEPRPPNHAVEFVLHEVVIVFVHHHQLRLRREAALQSVGDHHARVPRAENYDSHTRWLGLGQQNPTHGGDGCGDEARGRRAGCPQSEQGF